MTRIGVVVGVLRVVNSRDSDVDCCILDMMVVQTEKKRRYQMELQAKLTFRLAPFDNSLHSIQLLRSLLLRSTFNFLLGIYQLIHHVSSQSLSPKSRYQCRRTFISSSDDQFTRLVKIIRCGDSV